ncbi:MAG: DNA repair protein RecO [Rubrivivax sp.]|nr:DNA repair protein RecO [Rubrivivax sp.]
MAASRKAASAPLQAFVLHRYDWSETSLILELFTRERGRLVVVAKGAKRPYSQLRPVLLPFQRVNVLLGRPPGDEAAEVQLLRTAEWAGGVPCVAGAALFSGFYLNELLLKLLARQDPHPTLFDAYAHTLPSLAGTETPASTAALRAFELLLLQQTGVLPELDRVSHTLAPLAPAAGYSLQAEHGLAAGGADPVEGRAWLAVHAALAAGDLGALQVACLGAGPGLRLQLRSLLQYHLGHAVLRTRQVMLEVQRLMDTPR